MIELEHVELASSPEEVWRRIRRGDLPRTPLLRMLKRTRSPPDRPSALDFAFPLDPDMLISSLDAPGFALIADEPPVELTAAAVCESLGGALPFAYFDGARAFESLSEPGLVRIGLGLFLSPWGKKDTRLALELRVDATDDESWRRFMAYHRRIAPRAHLVRRAVLSGLIAELATPDRVEADRPLPGDELLGEAQQVTHGITIEAPPQAIWPWLVQMGARRAGFYAIDAIGSRGHPSATRIIPELQDLKVGDRIVATAEGEDGLDVLRMAAPRYLVLGALYDYRARDQLPFDAPRPDHAWRITWAFVLEPLTPDATRLHVRARTELPRAGLINIAWLRPVHWLMESAQLHHLKQRAEETWRAAPTTAERRARPEEGGSRPPARPRSP